MDVYEAIKKRKSVRHFQTKQVEPEILQKILNAARMAPSARNKQEWRFIVVSQDDKKALLAHEASRQSFLEAAPVIAACCAVDSNKTMTCGQPRAVIDTAIAIDHLTLAAAAEGLGTCWIGSFDPVKVREILGIPEEIAVIELLAIGYPQDPTTAEKKRKSLDEIVFWETWQQNSP